MNHVYFTVAEQLEEMDDICGNTGIIDYETIRGWYLTNNRRQYGQNMDIEYEPISEAILQRYIATLVDDE